MIKSFIVNLTFINLLIIIYYAQFSSVTQSCPTFCNPTNCSTPGPPVHQLTPGVYSNSCPSSRWCHPTISSSVVPFSSCLQSFPASGSFPMSQFFAPAGQSIGVSASTSVFPMNIQDWSPLGWTGWISLQSKGLSRVFSNTTCIYIHIYIYTHTYIINIYTCYLCAAAAAAKSHQSCPTLCDPVDGSPPGSPIHRILQARSLECIAISFSNTWKWNICLNIRSDILWKNPL